MKRKDLCCRLLPPASACCRLLPPAAACCRLARATMRGSRVERLAVAKFMS
jgi:hypothetical protein